jgi:secretion/DNA translocation related CpaE-like protein
MDPRGAGDPTIVVSTADPELLDQALSVVAAAGLEAEVTSDPGSLRARWRSASMLLVGVDQAPALAELRLPRRTEVYLLTETVTAPEAYECSMPLGAAVVVVPDNVRWLSEAIADLSRRPSGSGRTICVTGGSGGVGVSTLAAGLACVAARSGQRCVLVDLDPGGGGIDLLLGAERLDGWRWPRLAAARGHVGDLGDQLPRVDGLDLLSMSRGIDAVAPAAEAVRAVLDALAASHELTVADVPRHFGADQLEPLSSAAAWLLLVRDDLRGVTAGRERLRTLEALGIRPGLVVRTGRSRSLDPQVVADGVGAELFAVLTDEPGLVAAAERGDPPGRSARSPLGQVARRLLDEVARRLDAAPAEVSA